MKRTALLSALSAKKGDTRIVDGLDDIEAKTEKAVLALKEAGITGSVLLVVAKDATNLVRAARNIEALDFIGAKDLNPYAVLTHKNIVFTKKSLQECVAHFTK